jgi:hypothetical protein
MGISIILCVLVLASCGTTDQGQADEPTTGSDQLAGPTRTSAAGSDQPASSAEMRPDLSADLAEAHAALLTLTDFPTGWYEAPADDTAGEGDTVDEGDNAQMKPFCVGSYDSILVDVGDAEASTGWFTNPDDTSLVVNETVEIGASVDDAVATVNALAADSMPSCLQGYVRDYLTESFEHPRTPGDSLPAEASIGDITVARLEINPAGEQSLAFRIDLPLSVAEIHLDAYVDLVVVRTARAVATLSFQSSASPFPADQLQWWVAVAAQRLPTA